MNKLSTVLAIDTSTATMAGAVLRQEQQLAAVQTEAKRNHSIHIMTNIEAMLKESGLKLNDLDGIITGIGPGSYTGVRIAVTAAKTLAWTVAKPLIGVSSLAALAISGVLAEREQLEHSSLIIPIVDARRGQVYTAAFLMNQSEAGAGLRLHNDHIVMMDKWCSEWTMKLEALKADGTKVIAFVGDVSLHEGSIAAFRATVAVHGIQVIAWSHVMNGRALAELGSGSWLVDERVLMTDAHELVPNYAQLTEAEVKQNAKEKEEGK